MAHSRDAGFFEDHAIPGRCWRHGEKTFSQIFDGLQHRIDQCFNESPAFQQCTAEAAILWRAMEAAPITDTKRNFLGEQHRILARANALREALEKQDATIKHAPWSAPLAEPHKHRPAPACVHKDQHKPSGADGEELSPYSSLMSACLLLAALFEQTPFSDTDVRKRVCADFTTLKREFRHSSMRTLHGPTTSVDQLFGSIKDLDREGLCDNIQGVVFDDWTVHSRVDCFFNSDLDVEATCLTQEGPVGRITCRLRSFLVLSLLQERLLRDMFLTKFVGQAVRGCDTMGVDDPLDFYDFVEAMVRNTPCAFCAARGQWYAWLYAPEVNATPENWARIFGPGANRLPSLYDGINTPDDAVVSDPASDSGYSMDLAAAAKHRYEEAGAQAAVGFPWADDFLGVFLRKHREKQLHRDKEQEQQQQQQEEGAVKRNSSGSSASEQQQQQQQQQARAGFLAARKLASCSSDPASASGEVGEEASGVSSMTDEVESGALGNNEGPLSIQCKEEEQEASDPGHQAKRPKCEGQGDCAGAAGSPYTWREARGEEEEEQEEAAMGPGSEAAAKVAGCGARTRQQTQQQRPSSKASRACPGVPPPPPAQAQEKLPLPLGIFLVGLITSSAYTNTQIHIEDLMLMSININIFGAPKIWWWIPQVHVPAFKAFAENMSPGGRSDLYTKAVSPFLLDKKGSAPAEHRLPLSKLKEFGARRVIQMPGMAILTSPGYAFHFTVSTGLNIAESCNMFLEMLGWDMERLWRERPLEQYPDPENSMAMWMHENGLLDTLGLKRGTLHLPQ